MNEEEKRPNSLNEYTNASEEKRSESNTLSNQRDEKNSKISKKKLRK